MAAQSICEPATRMKWNTFNQAESYDLNINSGFPRLIEILDARKKISTPSMVIYLNSNYKYDEKVPIKLANLISKATLNDFSNDFYINYNDMKIEVTINEEKIREKGLDFEIILVNIKKIFKNLFRNGNVLIFEPTSYTICELRILANKIRTLQISGIKGIAKAIIRNKNENIIITEGSNLSEILKIDIVDKARTTTNDIHEIASVLGIEAARNAIINEMFQLFEEQNICVDLRHLMLISDMMTSDGTVRSIGRHGIIGENSSVLARSTFEESVKPILNASMIGKVDKLNGIIENIIVGQSIPIGTGSVNVVMKPPKYKRTKKSRKDSKLSSIPGQTFKHQETNDIIGNTEKRTLEQEKLKRKYEIEKEAEKKILVDKLVGSDTIYSESLKSLKMSHEHRKELKYAIIDIWKDGVSFQEILNSYNNKQLELIEKEEEKTRKEEEILKKKRFVGKLVGSKEEFSKSLESLNLSYDSKKELKSTVLNALENNVSCTEIQEIYDNTLSNLNYREEKEGRVKKSLIDELVGSNTKYCKSLKKLDVDPSVRRELKRNVLNVWKGGGGVLRVMRFN